MRTGEMTICLRSGSAVLACAVLLAGCQTSPAAWIHGGETLMPVYRTPAHELDYKAVGLAAPPMGFRWYHVDKEYVLANRTTGLILRHMPDDGQPPAPEAKPAS